MSDYAEKNTASLLVVGTGKLPCSVVSCALLAGHTVTWVAHEQEDWEAAIEANLRDLANVEGKQRLLSNVTVSAYLPEKAGIKLAIVITAEEIEQKRAIICQLEDILLHDAIIMVNMEGITLGELQQQAVNPERIIGLNWTFPAHTTFFLEIIGNEVTLPEYLSYIGQLAGRYWAKDPYIVNSGFSIRAYLFAAMVREALYLVENGFASVESVDRACRNDAGYYLPFAGNFRYMDLMGPYAYGIVMYELNPELSKADILPGFVAEMLADGDNGMLTGKGFYTYSTTEAERWETTFRAFSREIRELILNYPHETLDD